MKKRFLLKALFTALFTLLLTMVGKVNAQTYSFNPIKAETVGIIPYSDDFTTYEEVVERNYAITSFKMLDTATVAVLTGASDMILVYALDQNQTLYKIQLPTTARAFDYDNGLFHVIGDRTYLSIDQYGVVHERKDFQQPQLPNEEAFIISDLKVIDGQPVIHESDSRTYGITSGGLQEIDPYYYHHAKDCKIHPQYVDENRFTLFNETPSRKGSINVTMNSLGLEGKLSCIDYVSVDDDCIGIHLETTHNCTGGFVKSYLLALNSNGDLITLVEVPINFLAYIHKPFQFKDGAFYYAFAGQKGVSLFKIDTNTNTLDSPDPSFLVPDDTYTEPETPRDNTNNNDRGNWRTITQTWYNGYNGFISLNWTPISSNVAPSCTWVSGGYIRTPITSYGYTETGVPYKWGGWTDWTSFESLASQGKYTGNKVTTTSCGGAAYSSSSDGLVLGDDCSGFVSRCLEHSTKLSTSTMSSVCSDHGLVTSASSSDFQKGDALNKSGNHVMLYTGHNGSNQINVFECSATDWKTSARTYNTSYFTGYRILRYNYMKNIILRLASAITLKQNGSTVTTVTQGVPLTVTYSVKNFGTETWTGIVSLWIEQSNGTLICIQGESQNGVTTLSTGQTATFTFQNNGVVSPTGTTRLFVKALNYNAGGYDRHYAVGDGGYSNPKIFNIVEGSNPGPGTGECKDCPEYDELWNITSDGEWMTKSSTIASGGCHVYKVRLYANYTYTFKTCGEGNATFDTRLWLYDASCNDVTDDDDGCTGTLSLLEYTNTGNTGYYYLKLDGYNGAGGTYTLAAKRESPTTNYTISASANPTAGGSVTGGGSYTQGATASVTATANSGYTFTNWTENGSVVSTNPTYSFTVNGNRTLVAHFSQNSYTVSASANPTAGGTVSGGGTYQQGQNCTLTASANTGYAFTNWTESGSVVSTNATYSFTVNGNRTLVAHFSQNSYTVSASANPTAAGTVSGGGTYQQGQNCTLTASANTGYAFTNWTESGSVVSTNPTYSFTVNGNRTLVANFEAQGQQITNHYQPISQGSSGSMVITGVIQINGIEQASDQLELGVFSNNNECRGSSIAHPFTLVQPNYYMVDPVIYGDAGDSYTFKLYDHSIGQELNYTSPEAVTFNDNGYGNAFTPYVLNFESTISQSQSLASGWNWWSTYVETGGAEGLGMLENSLDDACIRIQSRNQYVDNYGTFWYGTLTEINNEESYRIRTNQSCTATLVGMEASPSNHPISVNPGWNWVGFPCAEYVSLSTAMDNFNPEVNDQLKSRHQYCSYIGNNQWYGTLQTLEPGQGYMYKSNASGTKTLVYQTGREESLMANVTTERNFFTPVCEDYADNMTLTAVVEVEGAELRSGDYEVAAFVGDQCRGSVKLMYVEPVDRHVAFLLAYGDAEEDMRFVLTDGTEAVLSGDVIRFSADGTVGTVADPVVLHFGTWGMNDEPQAVVNVFPNPSKDVFNVEGSGIRKVEVVDMWGQRILAKETKGIHMQVDLGGKAAGIYLLRVVTANGTITRQLIKED
ncbi:MAG: T9SS type A sorting domain-containing protein [Bacteroidales bacterium]|nr:T9SS type A sorting domain-containing protein [Bacteroidales bacterium]